MSASQNVDAVANQGEFSSRVPGSEPLQKSGHKPGVLASENDRAAEFSAQTLPAGTAPTSSTYNPDPDLNNQRMYQDASSTIGGATSADVHTGLGHPGEGQTSSELHHDGMHHRKKQHLGLAGLSSEESAKNEYTTGKAPGYEQNRNLGDVPTGTRGNVGGPAAEERVPVGAEQVASERD